MTKKQRQSRILELEERAKDKYFDYSSIDWSSVVECLSAAEIKEYRRLCHTENDYCDECSWETRELCRYSCVCGEKDDPECAYCIALEDKTKCPALD